MIVGVRLPEEWQFGLISAPILDFGQTHPVALTRSWKISRSKL